MKTVLSETITRYDLYNRRWYFHQPSETWMRSVTDITGLYPAGEGLLRWQCSHGSYDKMMESLNQAAERGTAVHSGIERLLNGAIINRDEFTAECWKHLCSFNTWFTGHRPEIKAIEEAVYSLRRRVAGTLDLRCVLDGKHTVIDVKTGSGIYRSHEIQVNQYAKLFEEAHQGNGEAPIEQVGILRTGSKHRVGFEFRVWPVDEALHKIFVHLHHLDYDLDPTMVPRLPKKQPTELSL